MKLIIPIILIFCCSTLWAQDRETVRISGTIINAEDSESVPFVHIINVTKRTGSTSDQYGRFSIEIPKSDTLYFSSVGFRVTRITFADSTKNRYDNLRVLLYPETITLSPVEIRAYNLEEILNRSREREITLERSKPEPLFEPKERIEKPTIGFGTSPQGGAALEGAITAFANLFNREFKQRQRLKDILEKEATTNRNMEFRRQFENSYIDIAGKITGLNGTEFETFLELYMPDLDFLVYASDYDLAHRIYHDFRDFRFKYKLEEVSLDELMENAKFRK
jgi:hypothetical protein